jgi:plasmid maintenance system antidote protein VapI
MYLFNTEYKDFILDGRTITYVAQKIEITKEYLTDILNGKRGCSKKVANNILEFSKVEADFEKYFKKVRE